MAIIPILERGNADRAYDKATSNQQVSHDRPQAASAILTNLPQTNNYSAHDNVAVISWLHALMVYNLNPTGHQNRVSYTRHKFFSDDQLPFSSTPYEDAHGEIDFNPLACCTDGTTVWVAFQIYPQIHNEANYISQRSDAGKLYAYNVSDLSRDSSKDITPSAWNFSTTGNAGNTAGLRANIPPNQLLYRDGSIYMGMRGGFTNIIDKVNVSNGNVTTLTLTLARQHGEPSGFFFRQNYLLITGDSTDLVGLQVFSESDLTQNLFDDEDYFDGVSNWRNIITPPGEQPSGPPLYDESNNRVWFPYAEFSGGTPRGFLSFSFGTHDTGGNEMPDPPDVLAPPVIVPSIPLVSREDRIAYAICKRVWSIPSTSEADTPIKVHKTEDGVEVPIDLDLSTVLEAVNHPLKKDRNVRWSDISMDRKDKLLLSTYNTAPPEDGSPINSCIIIIPFKASGRTPVKTDEISFINGTKTTTTNELAFVDEIGKRIYLLDTSDDSWKDDKYPLYAVNKISRDVSEQLRMQILSTIRQHPLGKRYISGGSPVDNPLYSYDEFLPGVNSNLFPKYINSYSMGIEVGEFRSGVWRYFENTFKFNAFKNSRDYQSDRSHNSTLYSKGSKIQYMYTPTFNASALRTIDGGPWKAITSKLSTSNRHELLAMLDDNSIEWYRWTGTSVEKARTLTPTGFDLINPTGLEWTGNNLYICDSGQKDDQIQKYSVSTTAITWVKTIVNPSRQDGLSLSARCRVIEDRQTVTEEECIDVPGPTPSSDKWYSGILPIDEISPGISGRNISLKIKIDHNQYLDIGTVFLEGSRPRPRK